MKVLITGATGFLGSHLCQRMVDEGHHVRILSRRPTGPPTLDRLPVEWVVGDVTDPEAVRRAVEGREWVVHAAASLDYWGAEPGWEMAVQRVNVEGTRHVAEAARLAGVQRLVHVSSVVAIGIPTDQRQPADEEFGFNLEPSGLPYPLSKRQAEKEISNQVMRGLDAVIVNPAFIFGPNGANYRGAEVIRKVHRGRIFPYFLGGICVVHVQDVVEGILAALEQGETGERYILGGENVTFRAIAERAASALNLHRTLVPVPPPVTELAGMALEAWGRLRNRRPQITRVPRGASRYQFYDSSKARRALGYMPRDFGVVLAECIRLGVLTSARTGSEQ
jgi:dihydroflavonol-4-reductase